jgi:N6-adenosine-specific RNA methylase IME4
VALDVPQGQAIARDGASVARRDGHQREGVVMAHVPTVHVDPEFKGLIPPLADDELVGLESAIVRDGRATVPLVVWGSVLLDGHNRLGICQKRGLPYETRQVEGVKDRDGAELWIIDNQLSRRNLSVLDQVQLRDRQAKILAKHAAANQEATRAKPGEKADKRPPRAAANLPKPIHVRTELAKSIGVGERTVDHARTVLKKGTSELKQAVRSGNLAVSTAAAVAAMPAEKQRQIVADPTKAAAKAQKEIKCAKAEERLRVKHEMAAELNAAPIPLPTGCFNVIVIDPPWKYDKRADDATHRGGLKYPEMTPAEIAALPVIERADRDCVLWLWTTNAFMHDAYHCLAAWGFEPKTILTWAKDRMGTGDWLRGKTEHCLMAVRGKPTVVLTNQTTLLAAPLREHSRKPDEFFALVEALCPGTKLEMFAREKRKGWQAWGCETEKF